jgi:hypothetical protein
MLADDKEMGSPTALVYETTERARMLLADASGDSLAEAGRAAGEAAYYLSDTIDPDERGRLLGRAETHLRGRQAGDVENQGRAAEALSLLSRTAGEVEKMLRGPHASSELRIGLRALRRATAELADRIGLPTGHLNAGSLPSERSGAFRRTRSRR